MANEFLAVTDGTFTLSETKNKNQFYFYRNDGEVLSDIDGEPMDLYHVFYLGYFLSIFINILIIYIIIIQ